MSESNRSWDSDLDVWSAFFAGVLMLIGLAAVCFQTAAPARIATTDREILPTLRRQAFNRETYDAANREMARLQLRALTGPDPTDNEIDEAALILQNEAAPGWTHVRHVIADNFLRWATQVVLRGPTAARVQALQALFDAFGPQQPLATTWRQLRQDVLNAAGGRGWFQRIGPVRVAALCGAMTNCMGNLVKSEDQSNLRAGTRPDLTDDMVVALGPAHVRGILDAFVALAQELGVQPRLVFEGGQPNLDYNGAVGRLYRYGYRDGAAQDPARNPLKLMSWGSVQTVVGNTSIRDRIQIAFRIYPGRTLVILVVLVFLLAIALRGGSASTK